MQATKRRFEARLGEPRRLAPFWLKLAGWLAGSSCLLCVAGLAAEDGWMAYIHGYKLQGWLCGKRGSLYGAPACGAFLVTITAPRQESTYHQGQSGHEYTTPLLRYFCCTNAPAGGNAACKPGVLALKKKQSLTARKLQMSPQTSSFAS